MMMWMLTKDIKRKLPVSLSPQKQGNTNSLAAVVNNVVFILATQEKYQTRI